MRATATVSRSKRVDALLELAQTGGGSSPALAPFLVVRPIDGVSDDGPALHAAAVTAAGTGQALIMMPGLRGQHWVSKTANLQLPGNLTIIGTPDTIIDQTLNPAGGAPATTFYASATFANPSSLQASPALGATVLHVLSGTYAVGSYILASATGGFQTQLFKVVAVSGTAPNIAITIDRPLQLIMTTSDGSTIENATNVPTNIRIIGNGMQFGSHAVPGTGNSFVHFVGAVECYVEDIDMYGDPTNLISTVVFDTGCFNCAAESIKIHQGGSGIRVLSADTILVSDCLVEAVTTANGFGYNLTDAVSPTLLNNVANGCLQAGITIGGHAPQGTITALVQGGSANGNSIGMQLLGASGQTRVMGAAFTANVGDGVFLANSGGGLPGDTVFLGCDASNNGSHGWVASITVGATSRIIIDGCTASNNTGFALDLASDTEVIGFSSSYTPAGAGQTTINVASCTCRFIGCHVQSSSANASAFQFSGVARASVVNTEITLDGAGGPTAFQLLGTSTVSIENITLNGTGTPIGINGNTGTTTRLGHNVRLDAAGANAINVTTPGAFINKSFAAGSVSGGPLPFTATGTTPVAVAFPDIDIEDSVMIQLTTGGTVTVGGAPGTIVKTVGTGFSYTGAAAGDLGVYNWRIVG